MAFIQKIKLALFRSFPGPYKKQLFRHSLRSPEFKLLTSLLKQQAWTFLDAGANKGEFLYVAEQVLPAGKIYAFEPLPWFGKKLKALFKDVTVFTLGLSNKASTATLYMPVAAGIPDDSLASVTKPEKGDFIEYAIELKTLDEVTGGQKINGPAFLKIDVEGHEFQVLEGGKNFIGAEVKAMFIEIEERHHAGSSLAQMIAGVEAMGFCCYYLHPQKNQLLSFTEAPEVFQKKEDLNTTRYVNNFWFFAKQSGLDSVITGLNQSIA